MDRKIAAGTDVSIRGAPDVLDGAADANRWNRLQPVEEDQSPLRQMTAKFAFLRTSDDSGFKRSLPTEQILDEGRAEIVSDSKWERNGSTVTCRNKASE